MKTRLLSRLKRLERTRAAGMKCTYKNQVGNLQKLAPDYTGERHLVTISRYPDGRYEWEERPGPAPADLISDDEEGVIRICYVQADPLRK